MSGISAEAKAQLAAALSGSPTLADAAPASTTSGSGAASGPADLWSTITHVVEDATGNPVDAMRRDSHLADDLLIDSLSLVDIAVRLEERCGVELEDETIFGLTTLGELEDVIATRQAATKGAQGAQEQQGEQSTPQGGER